MIRKIVTLIAATTAIALVPVPPSIAQTAQSAPAATQKEVSEISYGSHPLQRMDFHPASPQFTGPRPTIVFIHGGAWAGGDKSDSTGAAKIRHYTEAGYNLASVNYRLLPEVDVEDQARDVAASIAELVDQARTLAVDPRRMVIMGHSAGAHLGGLITTDPQWLKPYDLQPSDIAGAVLLDGPAYNVMDQIRDAGPLLGIGYQIVFGSRLGRQEMLSPATHVDTDNARRFYLLHVERRDAAIQARRLGELLEKSGTEAKVEGFPGRGMEGHNLLNAMLGRSDSPATKPVDEWLAETFARAG